MRARLQKAMEGLLAAAQELDSALSDAAGSKDAELADLAEQTQSRLSDARDYEGVTDEVTMALNFLQNL